MSSSSPTSVFSQLEAANSAYVDAGTHREAAVRPVRRLAVVTCMDSRIDVLSMLGLELGDAHVLRTAGGRVTDDVLRSLALSGHALGTDHVAVIAHTGCGLHDHDGGFVDRLVAAMGPAAGEREWYAFADPAQAVRDDCELLRRWSERPAGLTVAGYVLDVGDGRLRRIVAPTPAADPA